MFEVDVNLTFPLNQLALSGRNYILPSLILTFSYDELNNLSSTPCVNVTILDDNIPENVLYLTLGLSVASNDSSSVIMLPGKNQTTIAIVDSDHGMFTRSHSVTLQMFLCAL